MMDSRQARGDVAVLWGGTMSSLTRMTPVTPMAAARRGDAPFKETEQQCTPHRWVLNVGVAAT